MSLSVKNQTPKKSMEGQKSMVKGFDPTTLVNSLAQQQNPFPTPSPFSISVASTGWSSNPPINLCAILLRFFAFLFSFISALSLVMLSPSRKNRTNSSASFSEFSELLYCFTVTMLAFGYSLCQLFKGITEIADRGVFMSDKLSDYTSFIVDQLLVYLLVSSSSAAVSAIKRIEATSPLWKASVISVSFAFATFLVIAICALLSGYKLCKRIIW